MYKNQYTKHKTTILSDGNERSTTLYLQQKTGTATLVSEYAHTLYADEQVKDVFYEKINLVFIKLPKHYQFVILGNFNARVQLIITVRPLV